jgi:hypothetical protein
MIPLKPLRLTAKPSTAGDGVVVTIGGYPLSCALTVSVAEAEQWIAQLQNAVGQARSAEMARKFGGTRKQCSVCWRDTAECKCAKAVTP